MNKKFHHLCPFQWVSQLVNFRIIDIVTLEKLITTNLKKKKSPWHKIYQFVLQWRTLSFQQTPRSSYLLCLVQTSPEMFKNWSYKSGTIVCSQADKLWVLANKIIGSKWSIHRKDNLSPKTKATWFSNVTTINTQTTVCRTFLRSTSFNVNKFDLFEDILKKHTKKEKKKPLLLSIQVP